MRPKYLMEVKNVYDCGIIFLATITLCLGQLTVALASYPAGNDLCARHLILTYRLHRI